MPGATTGSITLTLYENTSLGDHIVKTLQGYKSFDMP